MKPDEIEQLFTGADGAYRFARWGRPWAPVVFGVDDATLGIMKGAFGAVAGLAGLELAENDPELGANLMVFVFREWSELREVPNLGQLIEGFDELLGKLEAGGASRYRMFRFDEGGAIRAAFVFVRMDPASAQLPAEALALAEAVQAALVWSEGAFAKVSPLGQVSAGGYLPRPEIAALIRAAYDPVMPDAAVDKAHSLRLAARMGMGQ